MINISLKQESSSKLKDIAHLAKARVLHLLNIISPIGEPNPIYRIELKCEACDLLSWLHLQNFDTKLYWANREGELETAGVGIADSITGKTAVPYEELFEYIQERFNFLNQNLKFYGGFCFDSQNISDEWKNFGTYQFIIPRFEIVKTKEDCTFACNISYKDIKKESLEGIVRELEALKFEIPAHNESLIPPQKRTDFPDKAAWRKIFDQALSALQAENSQKVVLARKSIFEFERPVKPFLIKKRLRQITPECFHFCFQTKQGEVFLGASPERLYKRTGRLIQSEALAGTQAKETSGQTLLNSSKDLKEHQLVVDAIEASLKPLCTALQISKKPFLLELNWGHHLKTDIDGKLKKDITDAQLLKSLHPTPAVAGYPMDSALGLIKQLEPFSRGWYAGLFGYVGHDNAEFTVSIRSGLFQGNQISLFAGAGILPQSTCEGEWIEIENKMNSFLKVFE